MPNVPPKLDGKQRQSQDGEKFKLKLNDILNLKDSRTTIMIKNIPNKYT